MIINQSKRFFQMLRREGFVEAMLRIIRRSISIPVACIIIFLWPFFKIRLIQLYTSRMGHFCMNTHLMLCALDANDFIEEKNCLHLFYSQTSTPICNTFLYKMWSRVIPILPSWGAFWGHVNNILIIVLKDRYNTPFKKIFQYSEGGNDRWNYFTRIKKQYVLFSAVEKRQGEKLRVQLGIPIDKPFVCIAIRDSKYLQIHIPNGDPEYDAYKNANIENYIPAIELLLKNGFYVIRMGKYVASDLKIDHPNFVDYANHQLRSDFMDIYLSAHCFFFISTSFGIDSIPRIFYRPLVTTNTIMTDMRSYLNWVFTTPKNVLCMKTQSLISYSEVYRMYSHFYLSGKYVGQDEKVCMFKAWKEKNWVYVENTPDEILAVVEEMLNFMSNRYLETEEMKKTQQLFWKSFPSPLALGETSYKNVTMRISPYFLKKHSDLLVQNDCLIEC